jgi:hypothetical protein
MTDVQTQSLARGYIGFHGSTEDIGVASLAQVGAVNLPKDLPVGAQREIRMLIGLFLAGFTFLVPVHLNPYTHCAVRGFHIFRVTGPTGVVSALAANSPAGDRLLNGLVRIAGQRVDGKYEKCSHDACDCNIFGDGSGMFHSHAPNR